MFARYTHGQSTAAGNPEAAAMSWLALVVTVPLAANCLLRYDYDELGMAVDPQLLDGISARQHDGESAKKVDCCIQLLALQHLRSHEVWC